MTDRTDDVTDDATDDAIGDDRAGGTGATGAPGPAGGPDPVGSVAEEAAKLYDALRGWARDTAADPSADPLGAVFSGAASHPGPHGESCTFCPLCRGLALLRQTSPEVRAHLTVAASSLLQAAAGLLESRIPPPDSAASEPDPGVERIDLDREWGAE